MNDQTKQCGERGKVFMKKKYIIFILGIAMAAAISGCGRTSHKAPGEEIISEAETSMEESFSVEEISDKAQEDEETEKQSEESEVSEAQEETAPQEMKAPEPDTTVYGNTPGNIMGGGLFLEDDNYFYLYHGYDNCVYRTDRKTGISDKLVDGYCLQLNLVDGKIYANNAQEESVIEIDPESGQVTEIRKGGVEYLMSADRELYFMDTSDNSLRKLSLDSMEETVLVDQPIVTPCIYKDRVYFALDSGEHFLYSVPREGGEMTRINAVHSYMPTIYKDRIYYLGMENEEYSIRVMGIDGSGEKIVVETDAVFMNLFRDRLYYVDGTDRSKVYFIDLEAESQVPESVELEARIEEAVNRYAIETVSEYRLDGYMGLNFQQDYMAFMCAETMDGQQYMDEYLYEVEGDRVLPVAYFFVDRKVMEAAMKEATKEAKEESANLGQTAPSAPQTPARTYPPGNYSPGSVYGPKLSQAELDQVADAVQAYLNSYDFSAMSDYDKVETAHDYLCSICEFAPDWRYNRANTAWGALVYYEAQCSGYARAMKALCDAMGIGCYYVHADEYAMNPSHQWNEVCIDGNWYIIDVQGNDKSGFRAFYLLSDDTYGAMSGMSWDRSSVPACPADYY